MEDLACFKPTDDSEEDALVLKGQFKAIGKVIRSFFLQVFAQITMMKADPILFKHSGLMALENLMPIFRNSSQEPVLHKINFLAAKAVNLADLPGAQSETYLKYPSLELHSNFEDPQKQSHILFEYWSDYLKNDGFCQGETIIDCFNMVL